MYTKARRRSVGTHAAPLSEMSLFKRFDLRYEKEFMCAHIYDYVIIPLKGFLQCIKMATEMSWFARSGQMYGSNHDVLHAKKLCSSI